LHYAASGNPDAPSWNPLAQTQTIAALVALGADPDTPDRNGTTPLHRAIRTRCAAAVGELLNAGADASRRTRNGSSPITLARLTTGRGGSGSPAAKAQQAAILSLLDRSAAPA
jgi:ankyrin repeat protein